jgi:NADH-quinone oxidoreductase subunit D
MRSANAKNSSTYSKACGARLTSYLTPAHADLPGWLQKCEAFFDQFGPIIQEYHTLLTTNSLSYRRSANIGVLSPEMAISYGTSGPVLRGSY